jgi:hypothetical protein
MRKTIGIAAIVGLLLICLAVLAVSLSDHSLVRLLRGVSSFAIRNSSSSSLEKVIVREASGQTRMFESVSPGQTVRWDVRTADLIVNEVTWTQGGNAGRWAVGTNVCPGEVFQIEVLPDGSSSRGKYER